MFVARRAVGLGGIAVLCLAVSACTETTGAPEAMPLVEMRSALWQQEGRVLTQPLLVDSLVIAAFGDGRLVAFHAVDGREVWSHTLVPTAVAPQLSAAGDIILVNDQRLAAIRASTGEMLWQYGQSDDPRARESAVVASGSTMYVAKDFRMRALSLATGDTLWEYRPAGDGSFEPVALALSGSTIAVGSVERSLGSSVEERRVMLSALDRETGGERWRETLVDLPPFGDVLRQGAVGLLALGNQLIAGTPDGRLRARSVLTRNPLWIVPEEPAAAGYALVTPLAVSASEFLVQRDDGVVERRRASDGGVRRTRRLAGLFGGAPLGGRAAQPSVCAAAICVMGLDEIHLIGDEPASDRVVRVTGFFLRTAPSVDVNGVAYLGALDNARGSFLIAVPLEQADAIR